MLLFLRKILSITLSLSFLFAFLPNVQAATTFDFSKFSFNSSNLPASINVQPGDVIDFDLRAKVLGGPATNLRVDLTFSNSEFLYDNTSTYIFGDDSSVYITPIPDSGGEVDNNVLNPPTDNTVKLTSSSDADVSWYVDSMALTINSDVSAAVNTITAQYVSDETSSSQLSTNVYIDVKPHITIADFSPTSIGNDGVATTTLTVYVKDYNGCTNLDGATVVADLNPLGGSYTSSEAVAYSSCDGGTNTATFQKAGIVTSVSAGVKTISLSATDEDGNNNDIGDVNFGSIDLNPSSIDLTVNDSSAPTVTSLAAVDDYIGGAGQTSTTLSWTASADTEEYKVVIGNSADCSGGTTIVDWTSGSGSITGITLNSSSLSEGANTVYACGAKGSGSLVGGASITVTKDTAAPVITHISNTASVAAEGASADMTWKADEIGDYIKKVNNVQQGGSTAYISANVNEVTTFTGGFINIGSNTILIELTDQAGNVSTNSATVERTTPPPSMAAVAGQSVTFTDNDTLYDGVDGRDFSVSWVTDASITGYAGFSAFSIYILPAATALDTGLHSVVEYINDQNATSATLSSYVTKDSANNNLAGATDYKIHILVFSAPGAKGVEAASSTAQVVSDVLSHPTLDSAEFLSDTELRLLYDIDLSTTIADHDATNILSQDFTITASCNGNSNGVKSVSGKYITLCIDSLATQEGSTAAGLAKTSTVIGQIDSLFPANVEITDTFRFTASGSAATASFVATAGTVANVTAGLASAINSADFTDVVAEGITAIDMTTYIRVYATTFNTSFTTVLSTVDGGGVDGQTLQLERNMENAVKADGSGYNCHVNSTIDSGMVGCTNSDVDKGVSDGQAPSPITVGDLVIGGTTYANDDVDLSFTGNITMNFTVPELLNSNSRIKIEATAGDTDANAPHSIPMSSYLTASGHQVILDVADLLSDSGSTTTDVLNSGTTYRMYIQGYDASGNSSQSNIKTNLRFDNTAPSVPVAIHFPNQAGTNGQHTNDTTPLITWFSSTDNTTSSGNLVYNLDLSVFNDFSANTQTFTNVSGTSQELGVLVTDSIYYWRVNAEDQASNTSAYQGTVESFVFDSNAPVITSPTLTDTDLSSINYTKNGDNVILTITLTDTNRDVITASMITADLSTLGGGAAVNPATYVGGTGVATWTGATVTCTDGLKSIPVDATDLAGNSATQVNATITCDNTAPSLAVGTITSPNGSENWAGGSTQDITWTTGDITETNLASLTLQYSDDNASSWNDIATGEANDGTYSWNPVPSLNTAQALVRLIAIDQVTQTGSDVSNAVFIIDSTNPTITANTLTAPNGGEYLSGGATTNITWTSGDITDTYLRANPITLDYYNGSTWIEIANTEGNDGTFSWNPIPSLNISNAQVRITTYDIAGNSATDTTNAVFTIDSTLPGVSSAETQDLDGNGQIDNIKFTFTENVLDSSVTAGDFDIAGFAGETFTATTNGDIADNDVIYITITESGGADSGVIPNYTYTQGTLTDFSGNLMSSIGATATTDVAKPVVASRVTQDGNGDGQLDGVLVTFSETMDASVTINTDFILQTESSTNLTETYSDAVDDTTLLLGFSDGASFDTGDLTKVQLSGTFQDLAGNILTAEGGFTSATDGADPIFSAETWIAKITPAVKVTFSEEVDSASDDFTDWAVVGFTVTAMDSLDGTTTLSLLSLNTNITDTSITPNVTYTADDVVDTTGNSLQTATNAATDSLAPTVSLIEVHDTDSDGSVETAYIQFTENIDDSSLTVAGFTLGSVTADNFSTDAFSVNVIDDDRIAFSLNTGIEGTIVQNVIYTASVGGLTDLAALPNSVQNVATGDVTEQDKAGPALLSATYNDNGTAGDVSDDAVTLTFSEGIDDTTLDTGAGNSDLEFTVASGGDIANSTTTSGTANDETLVVNLNAGDTALTVGTSTVALISGVLADSDGNTNTNTGAITINGSVIINEVMWMGTTLGVTDEFIELRNMSASAINISGWTIENAASGASLTIPAASTISGDGYFLIANFVAGSSQLNVASDWVTTTIDLADSSNGNLVLKDGAVIMDSAKGDTWPAGDSGNKYSMERNVSPGNGLTGSNWHTGDAQTNWDGGATEKGTPSAANVSDAQAPSFQLVAPDSRQPANNSLYPTRLPYISVQYDDNAGGSGIDTSAIQVLVDLNNDTDYDDPGEDITGSSTITTTQIYYEPGTQLTAGKHSVKIIVQDIAGNSAQTEWSFWLDDLTMTVENTPSIHLISGVAGETTTDSEHAKVTITTYGAGITLKGYMALLASGGNTIQNWDTSTGIGWDVKEGAGAFIGTINAMGNTSGAATTLTSKAKLADGTFSSQTYTFYIKIYGNVNALQQAGIYQNDLKFLLDLQY